MTTKELVERLRSKHCCDASRCNCDEAADYIERLTICLKEMYESDGESPKAFYEARRILWPDESHSG